MHSRNLPPFGAVLAFLLVAGCHTLPAQSNVTSRSSQADLSANIDALASSLAKATKSLEAEGVSSLSKDLTWKIRITFQDGAELSAVCRSQAAPLKQIVQAYADQEGLQGVISEPACSGEGYSGNPYSLHFRLDLERSRTDHDLKLPLPTLRSGLSDLDDEGDVHPESALDIGPPRSIESHMVLTLPEGWTAGTVDPIQVDTSFASYTQTVSLEGEKLSATRRLVLKRQTLEAIDRPRFKQFQQQVDDDTLRVTVLLGPSPSFPVPRQTPPEQAQAAQLSLAAAKAIREKDFAKATQLLDQVEQIHPDYWGLWTSRGNLAREQGNLAEALRLYQKQLKLHPDYPYIYGFISDVQMKLGQRDDAITSSERWMTADPGNYLAPGQLIGIYHGMHRDDLAASVGDRAMLHLTDASKRSDRFLLEYGQALMNVGSVDEAADILRRMLAVSVNPFLVNNATDLLAEHRLALPEAEQAERDAIERLDANPEHPVASVSDMPDQLKQELIPSSWDTLGWLLFNDNKTSEATSFLRAAWRNQQDPVIGYHLAELLRSEEKWPEAMRLYALAQAGTALNGNDDDEVVKVRRKIQAALETLRKDGVSAEPADPKLALAEFNRIDLGPAGALQGIGDYDLELSPGHIAVSEHSHDAVAGGAALINKTPLPPDFFPDGSHAVLLKVGKLSCQSHCVLEIHARSSAVPQH